MSPEQLVKLTKVYQRDLASFGRIPARADTFKRVMELSPVEVEDHCLWMCQYILKFIDNGEIHKAQRWLGWVQGVLFMLGMYTIEDLRSHNEFREIP